MNTKNSLQKAIAKITYPTYFYSIPLEDMFNAIKSFGGQAVDIDGTPWDGLLLGEAGQAAIRIEGIKSVRSLIVTWYTMPSGRYEVVAYVS